MIIEIEETDGEIKIKLDPNETDSLTTEVDLLDVSPDTT